MIPSMVTVPALVLRFTTMRRSPALPKNVSGVVFRGDGVVPAVPPAWIACSWAIVSEPEKTLSSALTSVLRCMRITSAGQGKNSYCHGGTCALIGASDAPVVTARDHLSCGIVIPLLFGIYSQLVIVVLSQLLDRTQSACFRT